NPPLFRNENNKMVRDRLMSVDSSRIVDLNRMENIGICQAKKATVASILCIEEVILVGWHRSFMYHYFGLKCCIRD
ncbi:MAG: hypothetical protein QME90_12595, partial [Thermodesulfobacteriota bacterium]|nr:hypothetical protein [Thermodesulfobacteriota bacterium]